MKLTYLDILEQCFHDKWKGYDKKEVDTFLHLVAEDFKELNEELKQLRQQVDRQEQTIKKLEASNGKGKGGDLNPEALRNKARKVIELARQEADQHLAEVDRELTRIKLEVEALRREKRRLTQTLGATNGTAYVGATQRKHEPASNAP